MTKPNEPNIKDYQSLKNDKSEGTSWTAEDCGKFSDDMMEYKEKLSEYNRVLNETEQDKLWNEVINKIKTSGLSEVKSKFKIYRS